MAAIDYIYEGIRVTASKESNNRSFDIVNQDLSAVMDKLYEIIRKDLADVQELYFVSCNLREIPEWILNEPQITTLCFNDNVIEEIPPFLSKHSQLLSLDLTNNRIKQFPYFLFEHPKLETLVLEDNQITYLDPKILQFAITRIQIYLSGNPVRNVSPTNLNKTGSIYLELMGYVRRRNWELPSKEISSILAHYLMGFTKFLQRVKDIQDFEMYVQQSANGITYEWNRDLHNGEVESINNYLTEYVHYILVDPETIDDKIVYHKDNKYMNASYTQILRADLRKKDSDLERMGLEIAILKGSVEKSHEEVVFLRNMLERVITTPQHLLPEARTPERQQLVINNPVGCEINISQNQDNTHSIDQLYNLCLQFMDVLAQQSESRIQELKDFQAVINQYQQTDDKRTWLQNLQHRFQKLVNVAETGGKLKDGWEFWEKVKPYVEKIAEYLDLLKTSN